MSTLAPPQRQVKTCTCGRPVVADGKCAACARRHGARGRSSTESSASAGFARGPVRAPPNAVGAGAGHDFSRLALHSPDLAGPMLRVGKPQGADERAADAAAAAFSRPSGGKSATRHPAIRSVADSSGPLMRVPRPVLDVVGGEEGMRLDPSLAAPIGRHLGADLTGARVHTGAASAASAREVGARAYTVGNDIVLGAGQYAPETASGRQLLVHELAHVAQQRGAEPQLQKAPDGPESTPGQSEAARPSGGAGAQARATVKTVIVDALSRALGLPPTAGRLVENFAEGVGEQLVKEGPGAITRFAGHAAAMKASDYLELMKGYLTGVVEGLVSPVTDLFGLGVFAEKVSNAIGDVAASVFNKAGQLSAEIDAVIASARKLPQGIGKAWETLKKSDPKQLVLGLLGLGPLPGALDEEAKKLGRSAGSAIVSSLDSPWEKDKGEPEKPRDWWKSPLAAIESKAGELEKRWIGERPWAKVGVKLGYAVGFAVIQVILFVFTEGIGNAIEQAAAGLGRIAGTLGKFGKALGTVAEFLGEIGRGVAAVEALIAKVTGAALKPLEKLLEPILTPLTETLGRLRTFLRKLLTVTEKEGQALEEAAAKALAGAEKHVGAPPGPTAQPPAAHAPTAQPPAAHAPTAQPPAAHLPPDHLPAAPRGEPLAREPVAGGHTVEVTPHGIELCSPKPCPVLRVEYHKELSDHPDLAKHLSEAEAMRTTKPAEAGRRAAAIQERLEALRAHDSLVGHLPPHVTRPQKARLAGILDEANTRGLRVDSGQLESIAKDLAGTKTAAEVDRELSELERHVDRAAQRLEHAGAPPPPGDGGRVGAHAEEKPPPGTHDVRDRPNAPTGVASDADVLAAELTRTVGPRPPGHEAHHIIPKGAAAGDEARTILKKAGIGINDAENGIWLPRDSSVPNVYSTELHSKVHTEIAYDDITRRLRIGAKDGPAGVRRALAEIRRDLGEGRFVRDRIVPKRR